MSTEKKLEANKLNAQKSTGPRTAEGKAVSAFNAIKHGLLAQDVLLKDEDAERYNLFYDALFLDMDPVGPKEIVQTDRIISLHWRLRRVGRMETGMFNVLFQRRINNDKNIAEMRHLRSVNKPVPEELLAAVKATLSDVLGNVGISNFGSYSFGGEHALEKIQVYEGRIERSLYKAQLELQKLQFIRKQNEAKSEKCQPCADAEAQRKSRSIGIDSQDPVLPRSPDISGCPRCIEPDSVRQNEAKLPDAEEKQEIQFEQTNPKLPNEPKLPSAEGKQGLVCSDSGQVVPVPAFSVDVQNEPKVDDTSSFVRVFEQTNPKLPDNPCHSERSEESLLQNEPNRSSSLCA